MIKLLVVDDSPLMRRLMTEIFAAAGDFTVEAARSGEEALALLASYAPDVVTMDVTMPGMNGLECLDRLMVLRPCPVVMVSALTAAGADETFEALDLGAVDFIAKPKGAISLEIDTVAHDLVEKVRAAAGARISRAARLRDRLRAQDAATAQSVPIARHRSPARRGVPRAAPALPGGGVVLVGSSTGGPPALEALLEGLPASLPWPVVIAQHMPASFTGPLARRLDRISALDVEEVEATLTLRPGAAFIARGDADIVFSRRGGALVAMPAPRHPDHAWHPSVGRLVTSAARLLSPEQLVGIMLTGMGNDGAVAMAEIRARGGFTIAEAEETAVVWGMPGALVARDGASAVEPIDRIAATLRERFGL